MRAKVNKAAKADKDGPHELTNITVKEVSVVDRAANKRTFLVTKNARRAAKDDDTDLTTLGPVDKGGDLAAELDAKDKATAETQKSEAQKALDAKDAADKAEFEAEKARLEKQAAAASGAPAAPETPPSAVAPPVETIDTAKALEDLTALVAEPASTKKDDAPTPVVVVSEPASLSPTAQSVKAAILSGIDKIEEKIKEWRAAITASDSQNTDQISGRPYAVWEYSYYLCRMIDQISNVGGPDWEMQNATIGKELEARAAVAKAGNKAITAARIGTLKGVHQGLAHCVGTMDKVMKELTETETATVEEPVQDSFAKAAPVAAVPVAPQPAPAPVVVMDPALVAKVNEMGERLTKSDELITSLRDIVKSQAAEINKARGEVSSNVIPNDRSEIQKERNQRDTVVWDVDLAPPRSTGRIRR